MTALRSLLLVEDSDADAVALERTASRFPSPMMVVRVRDGESALDYLYRRGAYKLDVEGAYADGANSYLFKPEPGAQLEAAARLPEEIGAVT